MKWPASCHARIVSTAPGYGSAASTSEARWVSATQACSCSGRSCVMPHVTCSSYGRSTPNRRLAIAASWSQ